MTSSSSVIFIGCEAFDRMFLAKVYNTDKNISADFLVLFVMSPVNFADVTCSRVAGLCIYFSWDF